MQCPNPLCGKILPAHIRYCPYCGSLVSPQPVVPLRERGWALWFWWVLANAMGWAASTVVGQDMAGAVLGPVAGVVQWLVLRRQIRKGGWWVLASVIGWPVALLAVGFALQDPPGWILFAVVGAVIGVAQWLVLRRQVQRAGWWVLASTMGWGMTVITQGIPVGWVAGMSMAGAMVGAITGIALVWLL